MTATFADTLIERIKACGSPCIAGLDPNLDLVPPAFRAEFAGTGEDEPTTVLAQYNRLVIDAICDLVPAVKLQSAYYEVFGVAGATLLADTIGYARERGLLVILDAKRGDIGSTSEAYAKAYLAREPPRPHSVDCMTLNPYLGQDSLEPFVAACAEHGRGIFICVLNSNPGAIALQTREFEGGAPLYQAVAEIVRQLGDPLVGDTGYSPIGAVVGATTGEGAKHVRSLLPRSLFLVPGIGAQGGDLATIAACFNPDGLGAIVSGSRSIMYPPTRDGGGGDQRTLVREAMVSAIESVRSIIPPMA
jgi:orotidine-5'-phosphate decarboxylase